MQKNSYLILGLQPGATKDEIEDAYRAMKAKYQELRFEEGSIGTNAAKMLDKIEIAYEECLMDVQDRESKETYGSSYGGNGTYSGSLTTIINLLSVIATNTEALNNLKTTLAGHGANIDDDTLRKAVKNAQKYSRSDNPMLAVLNGGGGRDDPSSSTQQIVAAMEILARG